MIASEMKTDLPHVTPRKNTNGTFRYYFRRRGQPTVRLSGVPGSVEFAEQYQRQLNWVAPSVYADEGSFAWLCDQYMDSLEFKGKKPATRQARRRIILTMMAEPISPGFPETFGQERAAKIGRKHVLTLRDRKADFPHAANERLKILSQIMKLGVARGWLEKDQTESVKRIAFQSEGHRTATDQQIEQYLSHHTDGMARLAMIMLTEWGMRVSDLRLCGPQKIKGGVLSFDTVKTGVRCELPVTPRMTAILEPHGKRFAFLVTEHNRPFASDKALSGRISKWFRQAGIEGITAHSVRKWLATRKAEHGATEMQLMAWFGWRNSKEAQTYTSKADRRKLAAQISGETLHMAMG